MEKCLFIPDFRWAKIEKKSLLIENTFCHWMRGEDFENNFFFGSNSGIKSGFEHVSRLLDGHIKNKKDYPRNESAGFTGHAI